MHLLKQKSSRLRLSPRSQGKPRLSSVATPLLTTLRSPHKPCLHQTLKPVLRWWRLLTRLSCPQRKAMLSDGLPMSTTAVVSSNQLTRISGPCLQASQARGSSAQPCRTLVASLPACRSQAGAILSRSTSLTPLWASGCHSCGCMAALLGGCTRIPSSLAMKPWWLFRFLGMRRLSAVCSSRVCGPWCMTKLGNMRYMSDIACCFA